ncbi:peptide ABC transporter substrate-binding protein [Streptomyces sp. Ru87]|nr:peptide ABC transporter substrate-binding protein [Streptomyces sp. Ru87]
MPDPVPAPAPDPAPGRRIGRSARVKITTVAVIGLLAAGIPATLTWLLPGTSGGGEGGTAVAYDAASKGVVNKSRTQGGTLRFAVAGGVDSWDPQRSYYGHVWNFARYYTRQLVTYETEPGARSPRLVGDLAAGTAEISGDRRTYTYELRDGAAWEDGSEVTSEDVKYGIERLWAQDVLSGGPYYLQAVLDPEGSYKGPYKDTSEAGLKAIRTPDKDTVVFDLPAPNSDFEHMLAMTGASPVKKEKDTKARYGDKPFSSGPYKFATDTSGKHLELVRNPHWDETSDTVRAALPEKITVDVLGTPSAVSEALIDGEYDLELGRSGLGGAAGAKAVEDPDLRENVDALPSGYIRYAAFPQSVEPMDDVHCRKAVIHAADHGALQKAFGAAGAGGDIAPSMLPPDVVGSEATYDPYDLLENGGKPDTAEAGRELEACGEPDGFSTTIAVRGDRPHDVNAARALRDSLSEVGITAEIDQVTTERSVQLFGTPAQVKAKGYGIIISSWGSDFPSVQGFWPPLVDGRLVPSSGNANLSEIDNETINGLLDDAVSATGAEEIARISREINHEVSEGAYHLPIVHGKHLVWRGPRLTNVYRSAVYGGYDFAALGVRDP